MNRLVSWTFMTVLLAGCTAEPPGEAVSSEPEKAQTQSLTLTTIADPKSFNPIVAMETSTTGVTRFLFDGLTRTNGVTTEVEPALAKSWEISEDGLTWRFHLREDLRWSDGQPLTADDVVFTFTKLIYNPDVPTSSRDIFLIEGKPVMVEAIDSKTVTFQLPKPFAPFLRALSQEVMPAHILRPAVEAGTFASTWGLDTPLDQIVGSGPFLLKEYLPGQFVRLRRNPHYWAKSPSGEPLPFLKEIQILIVQNPDVALLKFQEGEVDLYSMTPSDFKILKPTESKGGYTVHELGPAFGTSFIFFNQNRGAHPKTGKSFVVPHKLRWFTNKKFRQAVAHAIDKEGIINIVLDGLGYAQNSAMSPSAGFFYNPNVKTYSYDLDKARQILSEAGFEDRDKDGLLEDSEGVPVEFTLFTNSGNTDRIQIATMIRKDLERLGMKVHFNQLEFNTLVSKLNASFDWDAVLLGLTGGIEPHFAKTVWQSSGHLHMWYPKQNQPATDWESRIDSIFEAGVQELDATKRKVLYDEWQQIVSEEVPLIYTVLPASLVAVRNRFGNLNPTPYGGALHNVEEIYIRP